MPMSELALAIFDCDGTLLDGQHTVIAAMGRAFDEHGLGPVAAEDVRGIIGLNLREAITHLLPAPARHLADQVTAAYSAHYGMLREKHGAVDAMYDGIDAVLDSLEARQVLLGIATGKSRRGLDSALAAHGIADRFVTLQTPDTAKGKPDPDMILRALAETGVAADRAVMVGDTSFDMQMAKAAGVTAIGVSWGYHPVDALKLAGADVVVDDGAGLSRALIDRLGV
jgi:phosphoglycolate phosphatase